MRSMTPDALLEKISSPDAETRNEGWLGAAEAGVAAIKPLAAVLAQTAPVVAALARELAVLERSGLDDALRARIVAKQQELSQPMEVSRAARRSLWKIVRHAARPGAAKERDAAVAELGDLVRPTEPLVVRREAVAMLAELPTDEAVEALAELLDDEDLRDEACKALERIPTKKALAVLQDALDTVSRDFRPSIARSLRARGMDLPEETP